MNLQEEFAKKSFKILTTRKLSKSGASLLPYHINVEDICNAPQELFEENPQKIIDFGLQEYKQNELYKEIIDALVQYVGNEIITKRANYFIAGNYKGLLFSAPVAKEIELEHAYIKKGQVNLDNQRRKAIIVTDLIINGSRLFHYDDIKRQSIGLAPLLRKGNPRSVDYVAAVASKNFGGKENLEAAGLETESLFEINEEFLRKFANQECIDYFMDKNKSSRDYIKNNPTKVINLFNPDDKDTITRALKFYKIHRQDLDKHHLLKTIRTGVNTTFNYDPELIVNPTLTQK